MYVHPGSPTQTPTGPVSLLSPSSPWYTEGVSVFIRRCSVTQSCLILCDPMDYSTPGFPVLHYLPELAQTLVHCVRYHPTISSSVFRFSSCLQSFPASGSFLMRRFRWPKYWSFSINPPNEYLGVRGRIWIPNPKYHVLIPTMTSKSSGV